MTRRLFNGSMAAALALTLAGLASCESAGVMEPAYVPPPPPPAPPPPPPLSGYISGADQIAVTGSRVGRDGATLSAPAIVMPSPRVPPLPRPEPDTERYPDAVPSPVKRVADEPVSTFSIDVDTASYSNVRRFIDSGVTPPAPLRRIGSSGLRSRREPSGGKATLRRASPNVPPWDWLKR